MKRDKESMETYVQSAVCGLEERLEELIWALSDTEDAFERETEIDEFLSNIRRSISLALFDYSK